MNNPLYTQITTFSNQHNLIPPHATLIVGLSGGPDSVLLLHYLAALAHTHNLTLIAAHLDHEWRPDSYKDVEFCQELTQRLGIKLVASKLSDLSLSRKFNGSKEEYARSMRRHFLEQIQHQYHANFIALAHHADDQQETFFIRMMRGTSLSGLCWHATTTRRLYQAAAHLQ